jgi:hypothetical protein
VQFHDSLFSRFTHWCLVGGCGLLLNFGVGVTPGATTPDRVNLLINAETSSDFAPLIQRAEQLAEQAVNQTLNQQPALTEVWVQVGAERNGQSVPLLSIRVTRSEWQKTPSIRAQSRYFSAAEKLLRFDNRSIVQTVTPVDRFTRRLDVDPDFQDD